MQAASGRLPLIARGLSKCYHIYDRPQDRLKAALLPRGARFYREFWALRDVSFEVEPGEAVGIIGRNGSGKSTLLQIVAGTLLPSAGEVHVTGRVSALLELGSGFNPEFTGRENVLLNGSILGIRRERMEEIFDEIVAFADIGPFVDQPVKNYSSGMLVRLAFAVAVAVRPDLLIVDEALAVGDIAFQRKCYRRLAEMRQDGMTLLFVTHDPGLIRQLCGKAVVLEEGRMLGYGPAAEMADLYLELVLGKDARVNRRVEARHAPERTAAVSTADDELFASVPSEMRFELGEEAEREVGVYGDEEGAVSNTMAPFELAAGRYSLQVDLAHRADRDDALSLMLADWQTLKTAHGAYFPAAGASTQLRTHTFEFEVREPLDHAEIRIVRTGRFPGDLAEIRLYRRDDEDPARVALIGRWLVQEMQYHDGAAARPFSTRRIAAGGLVKIARRDGAVLRRAMLLGADGLPRLLFHVDDEIIIAAEMLVEQPIDGGCQLGILVRDRFGNDVFGESRSSIQLGLPDTLQPGDLIRLRCQFRAALRQDLYFLTFGMTDLTWANTYFYGMDMVRLPLRPAGHEVFGIANLPHAFEAELIAGA